MRGRHSHIQQFANWRFAEPRKLVKWNEILTFRKQQPEAVHDTFVTSTAEVTVPCTSDDIFVLSDDLQCYVNLVRR